MVRAAFFEGVCDFHSVFGWVFVVKLWWFVVGVWFLGGGFSGLKKSHFLRFIFWNWKGEVWESSRPLGGRASWMAAHFPLLGDGTGQVLTGATSGWVGSSRCMSAATSAWVGAVSLP